MTKVAPIMSELFPSVRDAVVKSCEESRNDPGEWTRRAVETLASAVGMVIEDQVRRDIIQAIVTEHVYNERRDAQALQDWMERGDLR